MKERTVSWWGVGRRLAALAVLAAGTLFVVSEKSPARADCFEGCDSQYSQCLGTCCVGSDCSYCGGCGGSYSSCASGCFAGMGGGGSGMCRNQTLCSNQAGRTYSMCMTAPFPECTNPDGTVDEGCCSWEATDAYSSCCWP